MMKLWREGVMGQPNFGGFGMLAMPIAPQKDYTNYPIAVGYLQPAHPLQLQQVCSPILALVALRPHT